MVDITEVAPKTFQKSAVQVTHTGDALEFVFATITLPGGTLGPNGFCRVRADVSCASSAQSKSFRIRLGGIGGTVLASFPATTITTAQMDIIISNRNSQASQYCNGYNTRGTDQLVSSAGAVTAAIDTSVSQDIVITGQLTAGASAETIALERYLVQVGHGA